MICSKTCHFKYFLGVFSMSMPTDNSQDFFVQDFIKRTLDIYKSYNGEINI